MALAVLTCAIRSYINDGFHEFSELDVSVNSCRHRSCNAIIDRIYGLIKNFLMSQTHFFSLHDGLSRRGRRIPTSSVLLAMGKQTNARVAWSAADVASPHHRPSCSNRVLPGLTITLEPPVCKVMTRHCQRYPPPVPVATPLSPQGLQYTPTRSDDEPSRMS